MTMTNDTHTISPEAAVAATGSSCRQALVERLPGVGEALDRRRVR
jgi:hypothetical protein